jgi:hypothetical protein
VSVKRPAGSCCWRSGSGGCVVVLGRGGTASSHRSRRCRAGGRPTPLGRAVAELGRITKTLYLLAYLDDETYRRRILTQLNRTESRHALARAVFHGQRGQLRQRYREGQEDQLVMRDAVQLDGLVAAARRFGMRTILPGGPALTRRRLTAGQVEGASSASLCRQASWISSACCSPISTRSS